MALKRTRDTDTSNKDVQVSFRENQDFVERARQYARDPEDIKFTDFARKLFRIALELYEPGGGLKALRELKDRILSERQSHKNQETYRAHASAKADRVKASGSS